MGKLRRILLLLFCGALLFLLQYVWLRPPPNFSARDDMFKTQGEGIVWQRYQGNQIVQQVKAQQATVFFAGTEQGGAYLDLGASPARVELQGEVIVCQRGACVAHDAGDFCRWQGIQRCGGADCGQPHAFTGTCWL